ncbi:MAG: hypothetical protein PVF63_09105 [Gammaproteobacteria bacterium]|jgi:hypothetical protein
MVGVRTKRILNTAALIAVLLFAQAVTSAHVERDDSHTAGEICAICVMHAQMGSANVAASVFVDIRIQYADEVDFLAVAPPRRYVAASLARGPPLIS